jgi:tRNA threonylcarbamoyladenosine biosynthesis protein TsaE
MDVIQSPRFLTIELASEDDTARLGRAIADLVKPGVVIGLSGPLGSGKTRLARAICEALGVLPDVIASPTFVLIHEYAGRLPIYHFDAYRLESPAAFQDLGVADYWDGAGLCLVEWVDRVRDLVPEDCWMITLEPTGATSRRVRFEPPRGSGELIDRLAERLQ